MNEVRWYAECKRKDDYFWVVRDDIYSGWFYCTGEEGPTDGLIEQFNELKAEYDYLDWRLVQENRSITKRVVA